MIVGVGVDLVEIDRVQRMLDSHGERVLARTCTEREIAYIARRANPAQHLAARLAAKEAAFKALASASGAQQVGWQEIEVRAADGGPPGLELHGRAQACAEALGVSRAWLSLSHSDRTAVAVVVFEVLITT